MRPTDPALQSALTEGLASRDPGTKAQAENIAWDEATSAVRWDAFGSPVDLGPPGTHWIDLHRRQNDYVDAFVFTDEVPHTFLKAMSPAAADDVDEQILVRIETLDWPLRLSYTDFEKLAKLHNEKDTAFLNRFMTIWNRNRDARPAFATFKHEIADDLAADDWAERLRDRLGLAHIGAEPIALMEYPVSDVLKEQADGTCAITVPSVLDTGPWEHFFPVPRDLPYGRAMSLSPCGGEEALVAEILHSRLTYRPEHMTRVAQISSAPSCADIADRRNMHCLAVQIAANREDFGR